MHPQCRPSYHESVRVLPGIIESVRLGDGREEYPVTGIGLPKSRAALLRDREPRERLTFSKDHRQLKRRLSPQQLQQPRLSEFIVPAALGRLAPETELTLGGGQHVHRVLDAPAVLVENH